jgi:hypothetical protein
MFIPNPDLDFFTLTGSGSVSAILVKSTIEKAMAWPVRYVRVFCTGIGTGILSRGYRTGTVYYKQLGIQGTSIDLPWYQYGPVGRQIRLVPVHQYKVVPVAKCKI